MPSPLNRHGRARPRPPRLPILALTVLLAACATGVKEAEYLYRSQEDYVRLEPIERGAPANAHPFAVSADRLRRLLAGVKVKRAASIDTIPVFSPEELKAIAGPLAAALSKAQPDQDVSFAVSSHRGLFGKLSPRSVTTGRVFARDDGLHLIFGLIQARTDLGNLDETGVEQRIVPGTRSRRLETVWEIEPGAAGFNGRRGDWLVFGRSAIPQSPAGETGAPPAPAVDPEAEEIENRLRRLESLREKGVISEEEYRERRRAILDEL